MCCCVLSLFVPHTSFDASRRLCSMTVAFPGFCYSNATIRVGRLLFRVASEKSVA